MRSFLSLMMMMMVMVYFPAVEVVQQDKEQRLL
jgi:hypothetical protein